MIIGELQSHQVRVEFRWVGGGFRAADHWSDGYATEEELAAATGGVLEASAAVGSGRFAMASGPSCEGWWLAQLQGLWMAKGTARAQSIHTEILRAERRRLWRLEHPNQPVPDAGELDAMFLGQAAGEPDMGAGGEDHFGAFEEEALVLAQAAENQAAAAAAAAAGGAVPHAVGGAGGWGVMFGGGGGGWQPAGAQAHADSIYHRSGSQWAMHAGVRGVPKPVDMTWTAVDGSFLEAARRLRGLYELC